MTSTAGARISHDRQPDRTGRGDDANETPAGSAGHDASTYPARAGSISWHLLADGYTVTWAPAPAGCSLTLGRHGPRGERAAYRHKTV